MRHALVIAASVLLSVPAWAAPKGKPKTAGADAKPAATTPAGAAKPAAAEGLKRPEPAPAAMAAPSPAVAAPAARSEVPPVAPASVAAPAKAQVAAPPPESPVARAERVAPAEEPQGVGLLLGIQLGGLLQFSGVKPGPALALEVGVVGPWLSRGLGLTLGVAAAQAGASGTGADARVPSGSYQWSLTQRELTLTPAVLYRMTSLGRVVPWAAVGPRVFFLEQAVQGSAGGQAVAPTVELATRVGVAARLGAEVGLGPGAITGEAQVDWADLSTAIAGPKTSLAGATLQLGYRLVW